MQQDGLFGVKVLLRFTTRLVTYLMLLFITIVGVIYGQPYRETGLRSLLDDQPDCSAPCFMGIQIGATLMDEAVQRLRANRWVGEVILQPQCVTWRWSGLQPSVLVEPDREHTLFSGFPAQLCPTTSNDRIQHAGLMVRDITLGDLIVEYGPPDRFTVNTATLHLRRVLVSAVFFEKGFLAYIRVNCPVTRERAWQGEVSEIYSVGVPERAYYIDAYRPLRQLSVINC